MISKKLRVLSAVVVTSFLFQDLSFAALELKPTEIPLFQTPLVSFELPKSIATIGDTYKGISPETIILVQDAHTNDSAQINTSKALNFILQKEQIPYIYLEAASGNSSLAIVRDKAPLEKRKQVAMKYLRKGTLDGVEYLDMTSDNNFIPWGVEDKKLYLESLHAYEKVAKNREKFQAYLNEVSRAIETLKPQIFGPSLQEFDQKRGQFLKGKIALTEYIDVLMKQMDFRNIAKTHYPHLLALSALKEKEKAIDFNKANDEQMDAMGTLSEEDQQILDEAAMGGKDAPFKLSVQDNKTQKAFYALLEEKLGVRSSEFGAAYPELAKYFGYLKDADKVDAKAVLEEQKFLEEEIYDSLTKTNDERDMHKADSGLRFLQKLFELTVTPDEFRAYKKDKEAFDIKTLTGFLNRKIMDLGDHYDRVTFLKDDYDEYVGSAEAFYRLTYERDMAFLDKMYAKMKKEGQSTAILVTGGYHTPNLTGLLQDKNASYIVVTPQVLNETNKKRYESLLMGQNEKDIMAADDASVSADKMDYFQSTITQMPALQELGITRQSLVAFRSKMSGYVSRAYATLKGSVTNRSFIDRARTPGYARTSNRITPSNLFGVAIGARLAIDSKSTRDNDPYLRATNVIGEPVRVADERDAIRSWFSLAVRDHKGPLRIYAPLHPNDLLIGDTPHVEGDFPVLPNDVNMPDDVFLVSREGYLVVIKGGDSNPDFTSFLNGIKSASLAQLTGARLSASVVEPFAARVRGASETSKAAQMFLAATTPDVSLAKNIRSIAAELESTNIAAKSRVYSLVPKNMIVQQLNSIADKLTSQKINEQINVRQAITQLSTIKTRLERYQGTDAIVGRISGLVSIASKSPSLSSGRPFQPAERAQGARLASEYHESMAESYIAGRIQVPTRDLVRKMSASEAGVNLDPSSPYQTPSSNIQQYSQAALDRFTAAKKTGEKFYNLTLMAGEASRMGKGRIASLMLDALNEDAELFVDRSKLSEADNAAISQQGLQSYISGLVLKARSQDASSEEIADHLKTLFYDAKVLNPAAKVNGRWYNFLAFNLMQVKKANDELEAAGYGRPFIGGGMSNVKYRKAIEADLEKNNYYGLDRNTEFYIFYQPLGYAAAATVKDTEDLIASDTVSFKTDADKVYARQFAEKNAGRVLYELGKKAEGHGWVFGALLMKEGEVSEAPIVTLQRMRVNEVWLHNLDNMATLDDHYLAALGYKFVNNKLVTFEVSAPTQAEKGKGGGAGVVNIDGQPYQVQMEWDIMQASAKEAGRTPASLIEETPDSPFNNATEQISLMEAFDAIFGKAFRDAMNLPAEIRDVELAKLTTTLGTLLKPVPLVRAEAITDEQGVKRMIGRVLFELRAWEIQNAEPKRVGFIYTGSAESLQGTSPEVLRKSQFSPLKTPDNYDMAYLQNARGAKVELVVDQASPLFAGALKPQVEINGPSLNMANWPYVGLKYNGTKVIDTSDPGLLTSVREVINARLREIGLSAIPPSAKMAVVTVDADKTDDTEAGYGYHPQIQPGKIFNVSIDARMAPVAEPVNDGLKNLIINQIRSTQDQLPVGSAEISDLGRAIQVMSTKPLTVEHLVEASQILFESHKRLQMIADTKGLERATEVIYNTTRRAAISILQQTQSRISDVSLRGKLGTIIKLLEDASVDATSLSAAQDILPTIIKKAPDVIKPDLQRALYLISGARLAELSTKLAEARKSNALVRVVYEATEKNLANRRDEVVTRVVVGRINAATGDEVIITPTDYHVRLSPQPIRISISNVSSFELAGENRPEAVLASPAGSRLALNESVVTSRGFRGSSNSARLMGATSADLSVEEALTNNSDLRDAVGAFTQSSFAAKAAAVQAKFALQIQRGVIAVAQLSLKGKLVTLQTVNRLGLLSNAYAFDNAVSVGPTVSDVFKGVSTYTVSDAMIFFKTNILSLVMADTKTYTGAVAAEWSHRLFADLSEENTIKYLGSLVAGAQARKGLIYAIDLQGAAPNSVKRIQIAAEKFGVETSGISADFKGLILQMTTADAAAGDKLRQNGIRVVAQSFADADDGFAATAAFIRYNADYVTSVVAGAFNAKENAIDRTAVGAAAVTPDVADFARDNAIDGQAATAINLADGWMGRASVNTYRAISYKWPILKATIDITMRTIGALLKATSAAA